MYFYPRNKFLHVELPQEEAEDITNTTFSGFVLPADYKRQNSPLAVVKLVAAAKNSDYTKDEGSFLVVPSHNVETILVDGKDVSVVPEHVVYGVVVKV
jgi:hypothetical protein